MSERRNRKSTFFAIAVLAMVLLTACSTAIQPDADAAPGVVRVGPMAADFQVSVYHGGDLLPGQQVGFLQLLGRGKTLVLNMWAGLCPPCRLEMPGFQEISKESRDEVVVLGLDVGPLTNLGTSESGLALVEELGITYPTRTTAGAEVVRYYQLIGMQTTYFVTADGRIMRQWTGFLTKDKLTELVQELIDASGSS